MLKLPLLLAMVGIIVSTALSGVIYLVFADYTSEPQIWAPSGINYADWTFYSILFFSVCSYLLPVVTLRSIEHSAYLAVGFMILLTLIIYSNLVWVAWVAHHQNGTSMDGKFGSWYHLLLVLLTAYSLYSLSDRYFFRAPWWFGLLLMPLLYFINSPFTPVYLCVWLPLGFGLLSFFMMNYAQPQFSPKRDDILDDLG